VLVVLSGLSAHRAVYRERRAPGRSDAGRELAKPRAVTMNELQVVGVRVELPTNQPIVLLREVEGERYLPIWIGAVEATAIAFAQQGVVPPRPLTHDLMRDLLTAFGAKLRAVRITEMRDNVFYADLVFDDGREVSARPSDAIALALRTGASIFGAESVLEEAGIEIADEHEAEDEVEKFREFLDTISPEDFDTSQG
jgi:bifunctional DNase/RNase